MYMGDFEERRSNLYAKSTIYERQHLTYGDRSITGKVEKKTMYDNQYTRKVVPKKVLQKPIKKTYYFDSMEGIVYPCMAHLEKATGLDREEVIKEIKSRKKSKRFYMSTNRMDFPYRKAGAKVHKIYDCETRIVYDDIKICSENVDYAISTIRNHLSQNKRAKVIRFYYDDKLTYDDKIIISDEYKKKLLELKK